MPRSTTAAVLAVAGLAAGLAATTTVQARPSSPPGQAARPVASIGDAEAYESDGALVFPITLDRPAPGDTTVVVATRPGTALRNTDYRPAAALVRIAAGETSGEAVVELVDDDVEEGTEDLTARIVAASTGRIGDRTAVGTVLDDDGALTLNLLHINDHHSHLQPDPATLNVGTSGGAFNTTIGGFPRVVTAIDQLAAGLDNVVKIHAGDAITGTLYYTLFEGVADADLMNEACFDIFAIGNHEFDDSDARLASFLDRLNADPDCDTPAISANIVPAPGTPLAEGDYIRPYVVKRFEGQDVGFVGLTIAQKTKVSSQPLESTEFLDEVETAQRYVDELSAMGIDNIVLVTHYGYENDIDLAGMVTGVDAIVGGDSHTALGDFSGIGLTTSGPYPTMTANADGGDVCVVQAWQYSWVVGQLSVTLDDGETQSCTGNPKVIVGDQYTRGSSGAAVAEPERSQITAALAANPNVLQVAPDPEAQAVLNVFAAQVTELAKREVGSVTETLCSRRVPDRVRSTSFPQCLAGDTTDGDPTDVVALSGARMGVNGGFSQQVVTQAFRARSFRADIALQNGGGVRTDIAPGPLTVGEIYDLLPFNNTLVELEMTGAEIEQVLEEALTNYLNNGGSDGAYPYGADIRWRVDETQPPGSRVSDVQVKADDGTWSAIDQAATYVVVTNSFLADGRDGWTTFGTVKASGRFVDTFIGYAQALLDYVEQDLQGGALTVPPPAEFSTQAFIGN